jgi:hypothetical protein
MCRYKIQYIYNRYEHIQISKCMYSSFIEYINLKRVLHIFSTRKCENMSEVSLSLAIFVQGISGKWFNARDEDALIIN